MVRFANSHNRWLGAEESLSNFHFLANLEEQQRSPEGELAQRMPSGKYRVLDPTEASFQEPAFS
jgi:hypothetical protein